MAIAVAIFSVSASRIATFVSVRWAFVIGIVFAAIGNAGMIWLGVSGGVGLYLVSSAVAGIGYGMIFSLVSNVAVSSVPTERSGAAVGISETSFELGTAFGLAILGSVATMVFRSNTENTGAKDTLSETLTHAQDLDPAAQATLADTARNAFVDGLHVTAGVNVALLAAMAVIVAVLLRTRTPVTQPAK